MSAPRPSLVDASAQGGHVTIVADGDSVMALSRKQALWLLARLAEALARSS